MVRLLRSNEQFVRGYPGMIFVSCSIYFCIQEKAYIYPDLSIEYNIDGLYYFLIVYNFCKYFATLLGQSSILVLRQKHFSLGGLCL